MLTENSFTRRHLIALGVIILLFLTSAISILNDISIYTPDSARYMIWARSLASFEGFKDGTGPEVQRYVIHAPLYALLLAPVARLFPSDIEAAKLWTAMFGVIALILCFFWLRRTGGPRAGVIGAFLLGANALFLLYATEILSDIPFLIAIISVFMLNDSAFTPAEEGGRGRQTLWMAAAIACAMLVREIGIALLIGQIIFCLVRKDFKRGLIILEIAALVFLAWMVRNDWIVAARELPGLTNGKLFTHHFFTLSNQSLFAELAARCAANAAIYSGTIGRILFMPMFGSTIYDLLFPLSTSVRFWTPVMHALAIPFTILSIAGVTYGVIVDFRKSPSALFKLIFLAVYGLIVLCYPINDIRFLLPSALLGIYYCALALADVVDRLQVKGWGWARFGLIPLLILLALPNVVWTKEYASANRSYRSFFAGGADTLAAGSVFSKPTHLAAEWIRAHTPGDAVLISQIKDFAYCIDDRKLINLNETVSLDNFEYYIRDYHVGYIVAGLQSNAVPEFEFQMIQSLRYAYKPVHQIGNLMVYQVQPKTSENLGQAEATPFAMGLFLLNAGRYQDAAIIFEDERQRDSLNFAALFYTAVAAEFSDSLQKADALFSRFMSLPQAGMYLDRSATHREIIGMIAGMDETIAPVDRAERLAAIGASYWEMGFRTRARAMLAKATVVDSSCFSAALYGMYFNLELGDTAAARVAFQRAEGIKPGAKAIAPMRTAFAAMDSLGIAKNSADRHRWLMTIAPALVEAGLVEDGIDTYRAVLREDPNATGALAGLAKLYEQKRRFGPAMEQLRHLAVLKPTATVADKISELGKYF